MHSSITPILVSPDTHIKGEDEAEQASLFSAATAQVPPLPLLRLNVDGSDKVDCPGPRSRIKTLVPTRAQTVTYILAVFHRALKVGSSSRAEPLSISSFIFVLRLKSPSLPAVSKHRHRERKLTSWITVRTAIQS